MYSGSGYSDWESGDVDVIIHEGVYHLFHLIIPNHDYIAHAVSEDGISWKRTRNALFVGDPGEWDDDMLWTMHVSRDEDHFRMYYTGLQRRDRGVMQRIGMATSSDLLTWEKVTAHHLPLNSAAPFYEDEVNNPRGWVSFRDPFRFEHKGDVYLLVCARDSDGPVSRRGCVGLAKVERDNFVLQAPLLRPMVFDDVECPCVFTLKGRFYLLGSIREDVKVRYWFADDFSGEYSSFHADVLLPKGNYAARIVKDGEHLLLYNFFYTDGQVNAHRVLPPPKELDVAADGQLRLKTYYRWEEMKGPRIAQESIKHIKTLLKNHTAEMHLDPTYWQFSSRSGYEIFVFPKPAPSFIWSAEITLEGMGKFGLVSDIDDDANGYFISFDITNRIVQIRAWGFNEENTQHNFIFNKIQSSIFNTEALHRFHFQVIRYGNYIEVSIDRIVCLTLIDFTYSGDNIGLYTASSTVAMREVNLFALASPSSEYASVSYGK